MANKWLTETGKDMNKLQITGEYIVERASLRNKLNYLREGDCDERKEKHGKRMKSVGGMGKIKRRSGSTRSP